MPNRTDDELKQIAVDLYDGKIFTDQQVTNTNSLPMVFMPLALGALRDFSEEQVKDISLLYEYISEAGPRSVNGMPIFFSMKWLTRAELETMHKHFKVYADMKESFLKTPKQSDDGNNTRKRTTESDL